MKKSKVLLAVICMSIIGCASSLNKNVEDCLFDLDAQNWNAAISSCTKALSANSSDEDAVMYLSAAYSGRAGVDILEIQEKLSEVGEDTEAFKNVYDILVASIGSTGLADLRLSITTLNDYLTRGNTPADAENFYGQRGLLESIEAFGMPTIVAQPTSASTLTPTNIDATDHTNASTDFTTGYNDLATRAGWGTDHVLVTSLNKNYCVLQNIIPGTTGFALPELQDQVLCQLSPNPAALTPADFQSGILSCAAFNFAVCPGTDPM